MRNLGKKLISQQDCLLESRRGEIILHSLDVDRVSWSHIYDWISSSRSIMMKCMPRPRQMCTSFRARVPMLPKYQKCALAEGSRSKYTTLAFVMAYSVVYRAGCQQRRGATCEETRVAERPTPGMIKREGDIQS